MSTTRRFIESAGGFISAASAALILAETPTSGRQPNFVVIFIDDMGYGDIEPFGSTANKTPHLNRMASEGMTLTSFYAAPVCTPSRAALMTGCYPKRVGLARGSLGGVLYAKDAHGLNPSEITIAEVLKDAGYTTGCFGKWHLGDQPEFMPNNHGFDTFYGIPYSHDIWPHHVNAKAKGRPPFPPLPLMRNQQVQRTVDTMDDQAQLCKMFTDEAVSFMKDNRDKPFFVYLPHAFVHHPRIARKAFLEQAGIEGPLDDRKLKRDQAYMMPQRIRAQVEEVDWSVGQILDTLKELGIAENTMVIFTSDNGGARGNVNAPLRGRKGSTLEGGMREPTIAWCPGTIPAGSTCDEIATTMDLLPTFAGLAGAKVPDDRVIDGKNIAPLLVGQTNATSPYEAFFYYAANQLQAVRSGPWKLTTKGLLYNLDKDIGEQQNVAKQHPEVVTRLKTYLAECRADLDDPNNCRPVGKVNDPKYLVPLQGLTPGQGH